MAAIGKPPKYSRAMKDYLRLTGAGLGSADAQDAANRLSRPAQDYVVLTKVQGMDPGRAQQVAAGRMAAGPPVTASGVPDKPLPFDAQYDSEIGAAAKTRDTTLAGIGRERTDALATYGYTGTFDSQGNLTGRAFDPNNPFSRAALLKRSYEQGSRGNTNRMAARGQLNSGAFQNLKNATDFNYQQGEDANLRSFNSLIGSLIGRQQQANSTYDTSVVGSGAARLARALGGLQ